MIKFLQPLTALLGQTFDSLAVGMSGINKALSYNIQNAITGVFPALTVDYPGEPGPASFHGDCTGIPV